MQIQFFKYEGTGNDFVMIDNRSLGITRGQHDLVKQLCDRKFGIGADGLILLQDKEGYDFEMVYFNADGHESSMCGNGGRCIVAFAKQLGIIQDKAHFVAIDGEHEASIDSSNYVKLKMQDVAVIEDNDSFLWLDTGSPHYVTFVNDVRKVDVPLEGARIRNSARFKMQGTNVNFVEEKTDHLLVRTYERGVEDETLSCGTGVTAVAISYAYRKSITESIRLETLGGSLEVFFERKKDEFIEIYLGGSTKYVFEGLVNF